MQYTIVCYVSTHYVYCRQCYHVVLLEPVHVCNLTYTVVCSMVLCAKICVCGAACVYQSMYVLGPFKTKCAGCLLHMHVHHRE
jgi:hypothetical protein